MSARSQEFETERIRARERSRAVSAPIFRHPMDAAFFGEYIPTKNTATTRAQELSE